MGHSHSGFASTKLKSTKLKSTKLKSPNNPPPQNAKPNKQIGVVQSNVNLKPSAPFTPSSEVAIMPSAPSPPSHQSNYSNNNAIPYYQQIEYEAESSPYTAVVQHQELQKQQQESGINPYINGYVNPYYANIHRNVDIIQCTTPTLPSNIYKNKNKNKLGTLHQYRARRDSNCDIISFAELAEAKIPKQNKINQINTIYKYIKQLGTGASSRVLLVENIKTKQKYAMKELLRNNMNNHHLFLLEFKILNILKNSDGIVQIFNVYMDNISYYIVMEYCSGNDLLSKIISSHHFSEKEAVKYIKSILIAIDIIHSKNICHRDLKPNNIVFDENDQLKIIDFGQSEIIESNEKIYPFKQVGTTSFVPPEFHRSRSGLELKKGDSWSIGCICFLLMCGKIIFGGNNSKEIWSKICSFNDECLESSWPNNIILSAKCKDFIGKLLNKNTHQRLSIKQALSHEWIKDIDNISDKHLGSPLLNGINAIVTTNKLQKILADAILSEMNENEIKMLMNNIKDKEDVIQQLIQYHHTNYNAINLDDKNTQNHKELMHHRAHYVMNTLTEFKLDWDHNKNNTEYDEFKSMEYNEDEKDNYNSDDIDSKQIKSVSVSEFKAIMKQSKKQYNVDKLISDLDPNNTGFIAFHTIAHFMKPVTTHRILPGLTT